MTKDEKAARKALQEYVQAIDKYGLDKAIDGHSQSTKRYMIDAFFAGFYAGRDYKGGQRDGG